MPVTPAATAVGLHDSRLVSLLSELLGSDVAFPSGNFSQRLGGLVDFKDSMRLASFHDELRRLAFESSPNPIASETLKDEFSQVRLALVRGVVESFVPNTGAARPKFPSLVADNTLDKLVDYEPYHRFYAAHQRKYESRIQALQLRVREVMSGASAELARLSAIDETMRDIVAPLTRKSLAAIPQLLGRRFDALLQTYRSRQGKQADREQDLLPKEDMLAAWIRPDEWLGSFALEVQALLLAELELRLMPILGLVEAVDEEVMRK